MLRTASERLSAATRGFLRLTGAQWLVPVAASLMLACGSSGADPLWGSAGDTASTGANTTAVAGSTSSGTTGSASTGSSGTGGSNVGPPQQSACFGDAPIAAVPIGSDVAELVKRYDKNVDLLRILFIGEAA